MAIHAYLPNQYRWNRQKILDLAGRSGVDLVELAWNRKGTSTVHVQGFQDLILRLDKNSRNARISYGPAGAGSAKFEVDEFGGLVAHVPKTKHNLKVLIGNYRDNLWTIVDKVVRNQCAEAATKIPEEKKVRRNENGDIVWRYEDHLKKSRTTPYGDSAGHGQKVNPLAQDLEWKKEQAQEDLKTAQDKLKKIGSIQDAMEDSGAVEKAIEEITAPTESQPESKPEGKKGDDIGNNLKNLSNEHTPTDLKQMKYNNLRKVAIALGTYNFKRKSGPKIISDILAFYKKNKQPDPVVA